MTLQDIRQAWRCRWARPGFTVSAIAMLALGIGANAAVFGLVNGLLLKPLPGLERGEVVAVFNEDTVNPDSYRQSSYTELQQIGRRQRRLLEPVRLHLQHRRHRRRSRTRDAAWSRSSPAAYFDAFGVAPVLGRTFTAQETSAGREYARSWS